MAGGTQVPGRLGAVQDVLSVGARGGCGLLVINL